MKTQVARSTGGKTKHSLLSPPRLNLLLIDDDPVFRMIMIVLGQKLQIAVTDCGSLNEVEALAVPGAFDVAVIDYYLDGIKEDLKGPAVAGHFKETPVLLVSRTRECIRDSAVWPSTIRKFLSKENGARAILEAALGLRKEGLL